MKIGRTIHYFRKLNRITQQQLAELSGINEKYLGRIERDESNPTIDKLEKICAALDIQIEDLLFQSRIHDEPVKSTPVSTHDPQTQGDNCFYYCNCCGLVFTSTEEEIKCPNCDCYYSLENNYIEKYRGNR